MIQVSGQENNNVSNVVEKSNKLNLAVVEIKEVSMQLQFKDSIDHKNTKNSIGSVL